jgi:hypothetical protein
LATTMSTGVALGARPAVATGTTAVMTPTEVAAGLADTPGAEVVGCATATLATSIADGWLVALSAVSVARPIVGEALASAEAA